MRELSTHGEEPERLPRLDPAADRRRYPEGFYGERNWEWDGAQRGPFSGKGPKGYLRSDDRIREDAGEALYRAGEPDASDMTVEVKDGEVVRLPISHGEGRYVADPATLDELEAGGRVVLRYADADGQVTDDANPNGSDRGIAGIVNERGNVLGLMPHPERACEDLLGSSDGSGLFRSLAATLAAAR